MDINAGLEKSMSVDDSNKKLSTKERIQQMKINLQAKRDAAKKV